MLTVSRNLPRQIWSFVDIDDVLDVNERLLKYIFKEAIGVDVELP